MQRSGPPLKEQASCSYPAHLSCGPSRRLGTNQITRRQAVAARRWVRAEAVLQQDRRRQESLPHADAASRPDARHQVSATTAAADSYVSLNDAQDIINEVVDANAPAAPVLLKFCISGQQELRFFNYGINGLLLGVSTLMALGHLTPSGIPIANHNILGDLRDLLQQGSQFYGYIVDVHPIATKAVISGAVYGLGDFTAQTYEGRSWKDFDVARILRSGIVGFVAHGPLSHFFYEKLDRAFIISKYFDGGDAWYTPIPKIVVDQTLFAVSWNALYYMLLGALKWESPSVIFRSISTSWWDMLKAGWRIWPIIHIMTYTLIPCQDRLLWVDMCELAWVTVLSYYGQQRRERAGAAACSLPGTAGEGGIFTDDILRGMTVESQVTFQAADQEPVIKSLDEVMIEAALMEANFGSSLDQESSFNNPLPLQSLPSSPQGSEQHAE